VEDNKDAEEEPVITDNYNYPEFDYEDEPHYASGGDGSFERGENFEVIEEPNEDKKSPEQMKAKNSPSK
jgi:hypothetical protein